VRGKKIELDEKHHYGGVNYEVHFSYPRKRFGSFGAISKTI
jgi:hypothetical protein